MKPLRVAYWVVPDDLQAIYDYHASRSLAKADRIIDEYDRVIALLQINPLLFHRREGGWRVYSFDSGTYLLYYTEMDDFWIVVGVFHASRDPAWIRERLVERVDRV
jgi:plasmid stabilization system protein ParE